jgi:bifunctional non-homologous end joining protein LigD
MLPAFQPLAVLRRPHPFNHSEWLFELKYDGFRALAHLNRGKCWLVSRNGHPFASFAELGSSIARELGDATTAVFDGEIVCVDATGRPRFNDLLFRRREPVFFAFDLLYLNGKDLRYDQLADRKAALRKVLTSRHTTSALHYADHISGSGAALYQRVCGDGPGGHRGKTPGRTISFVPRHQHLVQNQKSSLFPDDLASRTI